MKVALISDSHWDTSSRWEECQRIHRWITDDIKRRKVDLVLHGGDVFERKSNPEERNAVAFWLRELANYCPVVLVRGNHDALGDLAIFSKLKTEYPIVVEEGAGVHRITVGDSDGVAVACLAWPRKASLLASLGDVSPAQAEETAGEALRNVIRGLGAQMKDFEGPKILLMHAMVRGSKVSTGQPLVGCDMEIGQDDLGLAGADFVALGHIHCPQAWTWNGAPIVYPGSPRRTAYGETEEKGYVLARFDLAGEYEGASVEDAEIVPRWRVSWTRIPTPCTPMLLVEDEWGADDDGHAGWLVGLHGLTSETDCKGAEIRFRYRVPSDLRVSGRMAAQKEADDMKRYGALDVKIEEVVIPQTRARTPEIATAATLADKVALLWQARNAMPDAARKAALFAKLSTLEQEERDAAKVTTR